MNKDELFQEITSENKKWMESILTLPNIGS